MHASVPTLHTDAARRDALYAAQIAHRGRVIPLADEDEPQPTEEVTHAPAHRRDDRRAARAVRGRRPAA